MKIRQKPISIIVIMFSIMTIISAVLTVFGLLKIEIVVSFLGLTQFVSGIYEISKVQHSDVKEDNTGIKAVGIFSIILGLVIIITVFVIIYKMIYNVV